MVTKDESTNSVRVLGEGAEIILGRGISKCKGPEVRMCLECSRNIKEASG